MVQQPYTMIKESFARAFRMKYMTFPWRLSDKESAYNAGDASLIPGSGRFPRVGNGNLLQYSCLENSMATGAWQTSVQKAAKNQT